MTFAFWLTKYALWLYKDGNNMFQILRRGADNPIFVLDVSDCSPDMIYYDYLDMIGMTARFDADFGFTLLESFDTAEAVWDLIECTKALDEVGV